MLQWLCHVILANLAHALKPVFNALEASPLASLP